MTTASEKPLAQRNPTTSTLYNTSDYSSKVVLDRLTYGVPAPRRMLTPGMLLKRHDYIVSYLVSLHLTPAEREITLHLLRLFAYYGRVYPKANEFTWDGGCSKRSFWRAVAKLEKMGVVDRINRYLYHLQISNCYRLDKLVLCIIRYLAEKGSRFYDPFTSNLLTYINSYFWRIIPTLRVRLRDPIPVTLNP
ncbi:hypothetical protein ES708_19720 [subsurface metagenome]